MTKNRFEFNWNWQTIAVWTWPINDNDIRQLVELDWKRFDFWSYSTRHVRRCGNFYFKFRSSSSSEFLSLSVFGHVQIFQSHSFGHLESVMLFLLNKPRCINSRQYLSPISCKCPSSIFCLTTLKIFLMFSVSVAQVKWE